MLEQNNIDIPIPVLKNLFAVVNPRNPYELRMGEFIKFSFDEKANKSNIFMNDDDTLQSLESLYRQLE